MATKPQTKRHVPVVVQHSLVSLGDRVAIARKLRELTQEELAKMADVGISTIASIEGGYDGVSIGNFLKVMDALRLLEQIDAICTPSADPALVGFATQQLKKRPR